MAKRTQEFVIARDRAEYVLLRRTAKVKIVTGKNIYGDEWEDLSFPGRALILGLYPPLVHGLMGIRLKFGESAKVKITFTSPAIHEQED